MGMEQFACAQGQVVILAEKTGYRGFALKGRVGTPVAKLGINPAAEWAHAS